MQWFRNIPMAPYVIVVGVVSTLGWILLDGKIPLVISILAGGSIALKGALGPPDTARYHGGRRGGAHADGSDDV